MQNDYLRPLYDYNKPIGELHQVGDIFVCGTEMDILYGREKVKGINITICRNREIADYKKANYAVVTISEQQLKEKQFTIEEDIDNISATISKNYSVIEKAYADYVREVNSRLRER